MPTYVYECEAGVEFDVTQRITDPKLETCPVCERCTPKRLISGTPAFSLVSGASGGWASTGYAKPAHIRRAEAELGRPLRGPAK